MTVAAAGQPRKFRTRLRYDRASRELIDKARKTILSNNGIIDFSVESKNVGDVDETYLSIFIVDASEEDTRNIRAIFYIEDQYDDLPPSPS
jgi:uncharacterized protein Veg